MTLLNALGATQGGAPITEFGVADTNGRVPAGRLPIPLDNRGTWHYFCCKGQWTSGKADSVSQCVSGWRVRGSLCCSGVTQGVDLRCIGESETR